MIRQRVSRRGEYELPVCFAAQTKHPALTRTGCVSRGTTLIGPLDLPGPTQTPTAEAEGSPPTLRLAPRLTLGLRPKLLERVASPVPLGSSGGNFRRLPPGGGLNFTPRLPVGFHRRTFLRHRFLEPYYLRNEVPVKYEKERTPGAPIP